MRILFLSYSCLIPIVIFYAPVGKTLKSDNFVLLRVDLTGEFIDEKLMISSGRDTVVCLYARRCVIL